MFMEFQFEISFSVFFPWLEERDFVSVRFLAEKFRRRH